MSGVHAAICLSRHEGGKLRATLGIDLTSTAPAPVDEGLRLDVDALGGLAFSRELELRLDHALHKLGIAVVKCVAIFHAGFGDQPIGLAEKGDGNAV